MSLVSQLQAGFTRIAQEVNTLRGENQVRKLASTTLVATAVSIDIQNIPTGYSILRLVARLRSTTNTGQVLPTVSFNNDTTDANYGYQRLQSVAATTTSSENLGAAFSRAPSGIPGASAPANSFGLIEIEIPDYASTTKRKIFNAKNHSEQVTTTGGQIVRYSTCRWNSTAAINRITIASPADSLAIGSTVDLYGIK